MSVIAVVAEIDHVSRDIVKLQAAFQVTPKEQSDVREALRTEIVTLKAKRVALFVALNESKIAEAVEALTQGV